MPANKYRIPKNIRKILSVATKIVDKIPRSEDTAAQIFVKMMAIADSVESVFHTNRKELAGIVAHLDLVPISNSIFGSMFFGTKVHEEFTINRYTVDGQMCVEIRHADLGVLIFTQDYLREITQQLNYEDPEDVIAAVMKMRKLLGKDSNNMSKTNGKSAVVLPD